MLGWPSKLNRNLVGNTFLGIKRSSVISKTTEFKTRFSTMATVLQAVPNRHFPLLYLFIV